MDTTRRHTAGRCDPTSVGWLAKIFYGLSDRLIGEAVQTQRDEPAKQLGQVMVNMGALTSPQLDALLAKQQALREGTAPMADISRVMQSVVNETADIAGDIVKVAEQAAAATKP